MTIKATTLFTVKSLFDSLEAMISQKNNLTYLIAIKPDFSDYNPDEMTPDNKPFNDYRAKCAVVLKLEVHSLTPPEVALLMPGRLEHLQRRIHRLLDVLSKQYGLDIDDDTSGPQPWLVDENEDENVKVA